MLAPPGGGKGTIAAEITKEFGLAHISTGDLLREEIAKESDIGKKTKAIIEKGDMVPDDIVLEMIKSKVNSEECKKGFILDGFPRNQEQAKMLQENNIKIDIVLEIKVKDERVISRLSSRRICKNCKSVFNTITNPPTKEGICDKCQGELYQRDDDTEEAVKHRLDIYYENTAPLISYYTKKGILKQINGDFDTIPPVADQAINILKELSQ